MNQLYSGKIKGLIESNKVNQIIYNVITFFMIVFIASVPFFVLLFLRERMFEKYEIILKLIQEYNQYLFYIMILIFLIIAFTILNKQNTKIANRREKQKAVLQLLKISEILEKNLSEELSSMFNQKIQILHKQINSEEYRDIPLDGEFFLEMRKVNNKIMERLS